MPRKGVLFYGISNCCRTQIAEAIARKEGIPAWSAGHNPSVGVDGRAVRVLAEVGIDISTANAKALRDVPLREVEYVVSIGHDIAGLVPTELDRLTHYHWPMMHPAVHTGPSGEQIEMFRGVRDDIKRRLFTLLREL